MSQRVTLEDVARQSGVSLATVSLVLRDKPGINDETRQRVLAVARTLGYRKRSQMEFASSQGLQQVGMLHKTRADDLPQANQFYAPVVAGIEAMCRRQQIGLLYATVPVDEENNPQELPRMLLDREIDGMLLVGAFVDTTITAMLGQRTTPIVLVDAYATENLYDSVVSDNFQGAYKAVSYLIARGHRHIGLIGSTINAYPSIAERRRGYIQAMHDYGITAQYFGDSHSATGNAMRVAFDLLQSAPEITALFCCNDMMAIASIQAASALGRRVPDDLSIVGYDDIEMSAHVTPALTTMQVDKVSMGRLAVQLLLHRAEFPGAGAVTSVLRPTLIERQSVRSLP